MKNIFLHSLILENYRNFKNFEIKTDSASVILIGENGSGKTNILEAISLFYPARGLRSAKLADILKTQQILLKLYYRVSSGLQSLIHISDVSQNRRVTEFNGNKIPNNASLG